MQPFSRLGFLQVILILGALETVSPFAIDMYLPAFPKMAQDLGCNTSAVALSLSSYFLGLAAGQLIYGPLLDRFGRKWPLYAGLLLFALASIGCMTARSVEALIVFRFLQALGGCGAQVASMSMVSDFFPAAERAKIFSLLMLVLGVSPLLAPMAGSFVVTQWGWRWVFALLAAIVLVIAAAVRFGLPRAHGPDRSVSLAPAAICRDFIAILRVPAFRTYALSGAFAFSGLLAYVAGSPIIFLEVFKVSIPTYGMIFALLAAGFIGGNQLNMLVMRKFSSEWIYQAALMGQCAVGLVFLAGVLCGGWGLVATVILFFAFLTFLGLLCPNSAALALAPFHARAGSASCLIGFLQISVASLASAGVGLLSADNKILPVVAIMAGGGLLGLGVLLAGKKAMAEAQAVPETL